MKSLRMAYCSGANLLASFQGGSRDVTRPFGPQQGSLVGREMGIPVISGNFWIGEIWVFPKIGVPPLWMVKIMEHPIKHGMI